MCSRCGSSARSPSFSSEPSAAHALKFHGDQSVISRRERKHFSRQLQARSQSNLTPCCQFFGHARVVGRIADHRHVPEILRRRPQHRRPADIDVFDQFLGLQVFFRRGRLKRDKDSPPPDQSARCRASSACPRSSAIAAPKQNSAMHFRMQSLHASAEHLRPSSQVQQRRARQFQHRAAASPSRPWKQFQCPAPASVRANSSTPVLSNTLISARSIATPSPELRRLTCSKCTPVYLREWRLQTGG